MALQGSLERYEDDFVILSDVDSDADYPAHLPRVQSIHSSRDSSLQQTHFNLTQTAAHSDHSQEGQADHQRDAGDNGLEDDGSDLDIEEIEYGYDNDTLLIMPAMLRNYSHHATNYHPELWRSPIPGRYSPQPSRARCRQQDRLLDREELLKNSMPPTTCGICFDSFTTFDLNPLQEQENGNANDVSSKAQFALSFTARLARSFTSKSSDSNATSTAAPPSSSASTSPVTSPAEGHSRPPTAAWGPSSSFFSFSTSSSAGAPAVTTQDRRRLSAAAPTITPSLSSKDIGIVMPCDHGLCLSCLQSFLTNAAQSPQARFPTVCPQPGCRAPIPTEFAELVLDAETLEIWYRKLAEIHVANKVCCPKPECQSIIDLDDRDGQSCEQYQAQVQGGDTEEDRAMHQLVQDRHWRHCPSCRFVIEKQQGCNHMVCHCGQSFCYACGHPWNEMDARCSQDCESYGTHEDIGVAECIIM
ncbi:hypothetical protein EDD11_001448 [Mortierella claussenii]|nr:hypothetical protein EDD11_001448 [Mortierella claussenii]